MGQIVDRYVESISRVLKHIDENLDADLSVDALAQIALFSKFHFHRIFKGAMGETLNAYVNRRRLERAANLLRRRPDLNVTDVAYQVGFNSIEHFSRLFKDKFGVTARDLRGSDADDPGSLKNRKIYQEVSPGSFYHIYRESREMPKHDFEVVLRHQPTYVVATITEVFGENGTALVQAYHELIDWSKQKNLFTRDAMRFAISRDDVETTPAEQYRMEFGIRVPDETRGEGRILIDQIWGGQYAIVPVQGDIHRVAQAWDFLYRDWLPRSGMLPIDFPAIEIFVKGPEEIGWEQFDLEIGIPVSKFGNSLDQPR